MTHLPEESRAEAAGRPPLPRNKATKARSFSVRGDSPREAFTKQRRKRILFVGDDRTRSLLLENSLRDIWRAQAGRGEESTILGII